MCIRDRLKQYGEMLALLDQQQQLVMHRQAAELPENVNSVNAQAGVIAAARQEREQRQRQLARLLAQPENSSFPVLIQMCIRDRLTTNPSRRARCRGLQPIQRSRALSCNAGALKVNKATHCPSTSAT